MVKRFLLYLNLGNGSIDMALYLKYNKKPSALRFAFSASISIVGPFLSENESGVLAVLRAHRAIGGKNSNQRN